MKLNLHLFLTARASQHQKDPTHTANYGVKMQEKLRAGGVECELVYPAVSAEVHEWTSNYLIKKFKASATNKKNAAAQESPKPNSSR